MADEVFSPTSNFGQGHLVGGVSSAENGAKLVLRVNPTTKRLLVDATFDYTGVKDGADVDADTFGTVILGTDGTHYQVLKTDTDGRLAIMQKSGTGTPSNVSGSASNVTLLAANIARLGAIIYNDSTAPLYLKLGATASTTSFAVKMLQGDVFEVPYGYTGIIDGIWESATGAARVTEIT